MTTSPAVTLTQALVRRNTVSPPGNEASCAALVARRLEETGFVVTAIPFGEGRTNLIARMGGRDALPLAFTGHLDTVPLGLQPWSVDPFGGDIDGDRLYGRGSSDMKGGVAAFVEACIAHRAALEKGPGAVLIITAGEETGSEGAYHLCEQKGLLGAAGALIVAEPTSNYPLIGHKGALWLKAVARGVTAHGSMPERGDNAIVKAAHAVVRLTDFDFNLRQHEVLGGPTLNIGTFHGGLNTNSVPDRAEVGLDIRTVPGQGHASVREMVGSFLGDEMEILPIIDVPAVWTDPSAPWIRRVFEIMSPLLGEMPVPKGATYFTDASALTPAIDNLPTIILGPGEAAMAHQTDEYCLISRIDQ
ncbi:MAG: M20 family metallopeptidase, partial [Pseudomonadota bacterium]|nr:M20 family metallopeptidase [Pseudomonadota bacterium]